MVKLFVFCHFAVFFVTDTRFFFVPCEEFFRDFGFRLCKLCVAVFAHKERLIIAGRFLAVEAERILSFFDERGVVAIKLPISAFNRKFFLVLRFAHIDTVVDARRVANDKGRSVIRFCLGNCLDELRFVRAHGAFCDVNVFVSHGDFAKVFLLCEFAASREFCDRTRRGGFTCLSAGVAVNFGVKDEDIHVFARRDNVVESAVADVVCPAVAAEDPHGFLR